MHELLYHFFYLLLGMIIQFVKKKTSLFLFLENAVNNSPDNNYRETGSLRHVLWKSANNTCTRK